MTDSHLVLTLFSETHTPAPFCEGVGAKIVPIFYLGHWAGSNELLHDAVAPSDTLQILKIEIFQLWLLPMEGVGVKFKKIFFSINGPSSFRKEIEKIRKNIFFISATDRHLVLTHFSGALTPAARPFPWVG